MNFKPADTRRRYAKALDALSEASDLGTVIAPGYSWPVRPSERNLKQLRMYAQAPTNKLDKEYSDFPAVFFLDRNRNGNLPPHVLVSPEGAAQMGSWFQEKRPGIPKMRQPDTVRESGRLGEFTFIDDGICANHHIHGVSDAAMFMTKSTSALVGVRHTSPGTGYPAETLLGYKGREAGHQAAGGPTMKLYPRLQKSRPAYVSDHLSPFRTSFGPSFGPPSGRIQTHATTPASIGRTHASPRATNRPALSRANARHQGLAVQDRAPQALRGPTGACRQGDA